MSEGIIIRKKHRSNISVDLPSETEWEWSGTHADRMLNLLETGFQSDLILHLQPDGAKV